MRISIINGRVINPKNQFDEKADLAIEDGKLISVGKIPEGFAADKIIDAKDIYIHISSCSMNEMVPSY